VSGTGTITQHGCTYTLSHIPLDRRVDADYDECMFSGNASVNVYSQGITYTVSDTNTTNNACTADLSATQDEPTQIVLAAGEVRKLNVLDYLTLGTQNEPFDGSIRLRHNGASDGAVQAMLAEDRNGEEQSFTAPFIYATSAQLPDSTMQCAPIFYVGGNTSALLALQNFKNYPVAVEVKLIYGTGEQGTPNGTYYLPQITLAGQERLVTDLAAFKDQFQGAMWGSIVVTAPAQSVAAHTVMRSAENGLAFSSSFVDPAKATNTTKVAGTLKLDPDISLMPCVMICNTSSTDSRTVDASLNTEEQGQIYFDKITLAPGQQRLIVFDERAVPLWPGQSAMADLRLSYDGEPSDIMAGGVSMSAAEGCAFTTRFMEPNATDSGPLMSPFFKIDGRTRGIVQITNLGPNTVRAGVEMKFANSTAPALTSDLVYVGGLSTATLDIQQYIDQVPDGVRGEGCLKLIHNGEAGTVTCSFVALTPDPVEVPLEPGPVECQTMIFPSGMAVQPGETAFVYVMVCGAPGTINWGASEGTITPFGQVGKNVYGASYVVEDDDEETATIQVTLPGSSVTTTVEIEKVKLRSIATRNAQGVDTMGRVNPDGGTTFILTGKKDFPAVPLQVRFQQTINGIPQFVLVDVPVDSASRPTPDQLVGIAPTNTKFIGDAQVQVRADGGNTKISKKTLCDETGCSAYYSFDPPSPATSVSAPMGGFNRLGGNMTITAQGGGFRKFQSSATGAIENPDVGIDGIEFAVNTVNPGVPSTINGNVLRADASIKSCNCEQVVPCKKIVVKNPGGRTHDKVKSIVPLYNLMPGPAPGPQSRFPDSGFSIGGTVITIKGENLDFVDNVTVGGTDAPIISKTRNTLVVSTMPHSAGANNAITLFDIDCTSVGTAVPGGGFRYDLSPVTEIPNSKFVIVGPGEGVELQAMSIPVPSPNINCITGVMVTLTDVTPSPVAIGAVVYLVSGTYTCGGCTCDPIADPTGCTPTRNGTIKFTLANTSAPNNSSLRKQVTRTANVKFNTPSNQTCDGTF
jgi:IPT/TIG domain-containing protein